MDPEFAAAFSSEYPDAYSEAVKGNRSRSPRADAALAFHVPIVPSYLVRFVAGVIVLLFLMGGFQLMSQSTGNDELSIPSGKVLNSSFSPMIGLDSLVGISNGPSDDGQLNDTIAPIDKAGKKFFEKE